jgi:CheY-like chemotaxis protein
MEHRGRSRRTVLLVVADESLARVMERALRDRWFLVTRVTTGSEALELLSRQHPDSVILDPVLPDGTGDELLECLRQMAQGGNSSPAWIMVADLDRAVAISRYGRPTPAYLAKPFDPWDLVQVLESQFS